MLWEGNTDHRLKQSSKRVDPVSSASSRSSLKKTFSFVLCGLLCYRLQLIAGSLCSDMFCLSSVTLALIRLFIDLMMLKKNPGRFNRIIRAHLLHGPHGSVLGDGGK
ncbi:hypothetical protein XENOCAPTIV_004629 [Xenoophorus captivus]|uniref:Uncharacterized protein n=1 Tax=Xenoophorus captivus TaxID=1517983 RepID=A0ABV0QGG3_9TELE